MDGSQFLDNKFHLLDNIREDDVVITQLESSKGDDRCDCLTAKRYRKLYTGLEYEKYAL